MAQETENQLLTIKDGQTREEAIEEWWQQNGLDSFKAQVARKLEYERQRLEAEKYMKELKRIATKMDPFHVDTKESPEAIPDLRDTGMGG